jgi:hypothetical protein
MGARPGGERLIMALLRKDETLTASTEVRASAEWLGPNRFRTRNRRRLGRWKIVTNVRIRAIVEKETAA